jgi:hypothetical protein
LQKNRNQVKLALWRSLPFHVAWTASGRCGGSNVMEKREENFIPQKAA